MRRAVLALGLLAFLALPALAQTNGGPSADSKPGAAGPSQDKGHAKDHDKSNAATTGMSANVGIANGPDGLGTVGAGIGGIGGAAGIIEQGPGKAGIGAPPGEGSAK